MDRRQFVTGAIAAPLLSSGSARAQVSSPIPIADMHFHSFFADSKYHSRPVADALSAGGASLVAWSVVGDLLWVDWAKYKQKSDPKEGEALGWFERELGRVKAHCAEQQLKIALTPADIDRAAAGDPHIVLSVEGASFIEKDSGVLKRAYDLGVRHLQLVHYVRNPLGDLQTEPAVHNGLTRLGHEVVQECNRLGILIDLAHCTPAVVRDVLAISKAPVVWSHGSVTRVGTPNPSMTIWRARQLPMEAAKAIAQNGGVVGLWALTSDVGRTAEAYGDRVTELADWIGEDHVGLGTDINGLGAYAIFSTYAEVRRVIDHWQSKKIAEARIRKLAMGNYARVLKAAMQPAR